jgi:hypothetical protein
VADVEWGMHRIALLPLVLITFAACGDNTAEPASTGPTPSAPSSSPTGVVPDGDPVVVYESLGGCQMMGPNCPKFMIYANGAVEVYRGGENKGAELAGAIDPSTLAAFTTAAEAEDYDALIARLPAGTCQACVDGVDTKVTLTMGGTTRTLDSTVVGFAETEPLFVALNALIDAAGAEVGTLPVVNR